MHGKMFKADKGDSPKQPLKSFWTNKYDLSGPYFMTISRGIYCGKLKILWGKN